jgi:hypothetical protein
MLRWEALVWKLPCGNDITSLLGLGKFASTFPPAWVCPKFPESARLGLTHLP